MLAEADALAALAAATRPDLLVQARLGCLPQLHGHSCSAPRFGHHLLVQARWGECRHSLKVFHAVHDACICEVPLTCTCMCMDTSMMRRI